MVSKSTQRRLSAATLVVVAWALLALLVVPRVIREAYAGRSLPFLNAMIEGRDTLPIEHYLVLWQRLALQLTLAGVLATALVILAWRFRQPEMAKQAPSRAAATVFVGCSLALASGMLEAWYRATGEPASGRLPAFGYEFFWIAPIGMLLLTAPLILTVALVRGARPGWVTLPRAVFVLSVLPFLALSLMVLRERMPHVVHFILALAAASLLKRFAAKHEARIERVSRFAFPAFLAVPLLTFGAVLRERTQGERAAIRRLASAPAGAPNVLLIVWDTVRERELGLYGYGLGTTPRLDERATAGVVFDRAYATAPWTLPSHGSLFTGWLAQELTVDWVTPLERSLPTLAEVLASHGFRTGGFTANLGATVRPTGLARGFHHYEDWPVSWRPGDIWHHLTLVQALRHYPPFSGVRSFRIYAKDAPEVTDAFLRWLDDPAGRDRPSFAFLNYFNAHQPYRAPQSYRRRFPGDTARSRYDAAIAYQDDELERLFAALDARGLLHRTIVLLTSDHGEAFGDHGIWGHGGDLHVEQLQVPLLLWAPGRVPAGLRVAAPVSLADVPNTLLDLALPDPPLDVLRGRSLARFWRGAPATPDTIVAGFHRPVRDTGLVATSNGSSLIIDRFHYVLTDAEFLFDLETDPEERHNLIGVDSLQPLVAARREYLRTRFGPYWARVGPPGRDPAAFTPPARARNPRSIEALTAAPGSR